MRDDFDPTVYLLASHRQGTLYVGVTSSLPKRLYQHRQGLIEGFTKDYGIGRLVWFEHMRQWSMRSIARNGSRSGSGRGRFR